MTPLFAKLNWKDQPIRVLDAPASFQQELEPMRSAPVITAQPIADEGPIPFLLAFVTTRQRVAGIAALVARCTHGDSVVWLAYPKRTSRRYSSEIDRDNGWESLRDAGFDTVRQVAIDEDWSALRFRRAEYITRR